MFQKVIASRVSLLQVVGIVIGVVVLVQTNGSNGTKDSTTISKTEAVTQFCEPTIHKDVCEKTLNSVNSTEPHDLLRAVVLSTQEAINKSFNLSDSLIVEATKKHDNSSKMAIEDCKDLLDSAVQELQASYSLVGDTKMNNMDKPVSQLMSWLNAVITYQEACLDGFEGENNTFKSAMQDGFVYARQLASDALAIVSQLSEIFDSPSHRNLLQAGSDGFPTWFSAADRRLLQAAGGGAAPDAIIPNAVVAQDGSGKFKTIQEALLAYPKNLQGRYVIYIKAGIYHEYITVDKPNVFMYGDGSDKTVVTGSKSFAQGVKTMHTATFAAVAPGFMAKDMGFRNTAGPEGHQALALRVQSDTSAFFNCRMDGYQDTLCTVAHRQFYYNCTISGTIDFIFGDASALIQNSQIVVRRPSKGQSNVITAQGKEDPKQTTALVIQNCNIVAEDQLLPDKSTVKTFLGRPWKDFSTTVFLGNTIPDFVDPEGYMPYEGPRGLTTCQYLEFGNTGPGSVTNRRVKWPGVKVINKDHAMRFTVEQLFGKDVQWLKNNRVPFDTGLKQK